MDFFSSAAEKAAPTAFFLGLGLLFAGLIFRARVLDIAGACLIGLVLIGVVLDNYLPLQAQVGGVIAPNVRRAQI